MTFGEKVYSLRKQKGYSLEKLANLLGITVEQLAKAEDDDLTLELAKIKELSQIFDVKLSTLVDDSLSLEGIESSNVVNEVIEVESSFVHNFIEGRFKNSFFFTIGIILFILSPVGLVFLSVCGEADVINIDIDILEIIGLVILLVFVAAGVGLLIYSYFSLKEYTEVIDKPFKIRNVDVEVVNAKKNHYKNKYITFTISGVVLLVLALIPLLVSSIKDEESLEMAIGFCTTFGLVAVGVGLLVFTNYNNNTFDYLLNGREKKKSVDASNKIIEAVQSCLWIITVGIYLAVSFITKRWDITWIIFVISGLISAVIGVVNDCLKKN